MSYNVHVHRVALGGTNDSCAEANGGYGGLGILKNGLPNNEYVGNGEDAMNSPGGAGGKPGETIRGERGGNGPAIEPAKATDGEGGTVISNLENGVWTNLGNGLAGVDGEHGSGGGGGGGGAYFDGFLLGSHGGGGGAGGCGGAGGEGGEAGGSSFGLLLSSSQVRLENSRFIAGRGGKGGDGGIGGEGGAGGAAGITSYYYGGRSGDNKDPEVYPYDRRGGSGGNGAKGQDGGDGGGGAGGVSYGAYCHDSELTIVGTVTFEKGTAGAGGKGSSAELDGQDGLAEDTFECF